MAEIRRDDPEAYEDFRAIFAKVNEALAREGLSAHHEPDEIAHPVSLDLYGYSGLHYLRRIAAHLAYTGKLPLPGDDSASDDKLLQRYYKESCTEQTPRSKLLGLFGKSSLASDFSFNHLIDHSDCEGFYLPTDFEPVIFPDSTLNIPGEMIGSSQKLLRECKRLADVLEIPHDVDPESDDLYFLPEKQGQGAGWRSYGVESFTCVRLIHGCEASIRSGAALVFT